jgi:hypothetical protein
MTSRPFSLRNIEEVKQGTKLTQAHVKLGRVDLLLDQAVAEDSMV